MSNIFYKSHNLQYTRNIDPLTNKGYIVTGTATSSLSQENADTIASNKVESDKNIIDYILDILSNRVQYILNSNNITASSQGPTGEKGEVGPRGLQGIQGLIGPTGEKGEVGPQGIQGLVGPTGEKGDVGPQGIQGLVGPTGEKGEVGPQGLVGPTGEKGEVGQTGPQGEVGPIGPQGESGPTGPQGLSGITELYLFPNNFLNLNSLTMNNIVETFNGTYLPVIQCSSSVDTFYQCFVPVPTNWTNKRSVNIEINWINSISNNDNWSFSYDIQPVIVNNPLPISNKSSVLLNSSNPNIISKSIINHNTMNLSEQIVDKELLSGYLVSIGRNGTSDTNNGNINILSVYLS
jgi:hypothetical protein